MGVPDSGNLTNRGCPGFHKSWVSRIPGVPDSSDEPVVGKPDFARFLRHIEGANSDLRLTIDTVLIDGDGAAVTGHMRMTDAEGDRKAYAFCDVYQLEDGKVAALTAFVQPIKIESK